MKRALRLAVAFAFGLSLVLGGCTPKVGPTPTPGPTPPPAAPVTPTPTVAPATPRAATPTPVVRPTGELRIALASLNTEVLDPKFSVSTDRFYNELLFDNLVGVGPDGKPSAETGLAHKWEASPDRSRWTFYLRQGVKFHDGTEVTAEDVKFSIERISEPDSVATSAAEFRAMVDRVEVVDRYTAVLVAKKPWPLAYFYMSPITGTEGMVLPKKYYQEKGKDYSLTHPVGSGPYRLVKHERDSFMEFEAQDQHWRMGVPRFKKLLLYKIPEYSTRLAVLRIGQADVIDIPRPFTKEVQKAGFPTISQPEGVQVALWFMQKWEADNPLYPKKVREALMLAINKQEIVDYIFGGDGKPWGAYAFFPISIGYDPTLKPYPYDLARAKALLAEAGFAKGLSLDLYAYPWRGVPEGKELMEAVAGYWDKLGIKSKIISGEYVVFREKWSKKQLGGGVVGWVGLDTWLWPHRHFAITSGDVPLSRLKDPAFEGLLAKAAAETDLAKVDEIMRQASRYHYDNFLEGPIALLNVPYGVGPKVKEWSFIPVAFSLSILNIK